MTRDTLKTRLAPFVAVSLALTVYLAVPLALPCLAEPEPALEEYQAELPEGTVLSVILLDDLTSETAYIGQPILAAVAQDIYIGTSRVLATHDRVEGQVIRVEQPMVGRNAILEIEFNRIILEEGFQIPMRARVDTGSTNRYWGGQLTPGTELKVVPYHIYQIGSYGRAMYMGERAMGVHMKIPPGERLRLIMMHPVPVYTFNSDILDGGY